MKLAYTNGSMIKTNLPIVSVVICVINPHPIYFVEAVGSILQQTLKDFELIIIEEPSSASAGDILKKFDDDRIRHFLHPFRTSLIEQRNRGIEYAKTNLIAVLDSDDIAEPDRLEKQVAYLNSHPEVGVLGAQLHLIDSEGRTIGYRHYPTGPDVIAETMKLFNPIGQPSVMYRKSLVKSMGGYNYTRYSVNSDYELWCRLASNGVKLANLKEVLVRYRIHPMGMKTTKLREVVKATIDIKQKYFHGRMGPRALLRLWIEKMLLLLPPLLVLKLFLRMNLKNRPPYSGA